MKLLNVRTLLVEVANNGTMDVRGSGTGLGSKMLDDVSVAWQLDDTAEGIVLKVWLPTVGAAVVEDGLASEVVTVLDRSD